MIIKPDAKYNFLADLNDLGHTTEERQMAMEVIAFQNDKTFEELTTLVENIYTNIKQGEVGLEKEYIKLSDYIFDRFGMKVLVLFKPESAAAIGAKHPICLPVMQAFVKRDSLKYAHHEVGLKILNLIKPDPSMVGTIDLKKAKVSGFYSKVPFEMHIFFRMFAGSGMQPAQLAAIILHELGHAFFSLEFMFRTYRAAQILSAVHQAKTNRANDIVYDDVIDVCMERIKKEGLIEDITDFVTATKVENDTVRREIVLSLVWQKLATDYGHEASKAANFENLADQFVTRFGAGAALSSALLVYGGTFGMAYGNSQRIADYFVTAIMGLSIIGIPMLLLKILFSGRVKEGFITYGDIYAKPHERFMRIRRGIVENLKEGAVSDGVRQDLIRQIEGIDRTLKNYSDYESIAEKVAFFIFSKRRSVADAVKLETDLETLVNNDLFVASSKLRTHL